MMQSIGKTLLSVTLSAILVGSIFVAAFTMSNYAYAQVADDPAASGAGNSDAGSSDPSSSNSTSESNSTASSSSSESDNSTTSENSNATDATPNSDTSGTDPSNSSETSSTDSGLSSTNSTSDSTNAEQNTTSSENHEPVESSVTLEHSDIEINSPVSWVQTVTLSDEQEAIVVELPADAEIIAVTTLEGQSVNSSAIVEDPPTFDSAVVVALDDVFEVLQEDAETKLIAIEEPATGYDIAFETDAPYTIENEQSTHEVYQKNVTVTHDSELHYTDVKSYSDIPEDMVLQGTNITLFWMVDGVKTDVTTDERFSVNFADTDGNGIADRMEWNVPRLSEQQFVIEVIIPPTKAEHFDSNGNFVEDVYEEVKERDGLFTGQIPAGDFIRVIFEQPLTSVNDITILARSGSNGTVEVYEKGGDVLLATFSTIGEDGMYKIYLTNLAGSQDTFDLKVTESEVEFDQIIDPTLVITLSPIADVSRSLWTSFGTGSGCSNTSHYACVDEAPPRSNNDGTSSLIEFTGNNANDRFDIASANIPSNAVITSVVLHVVADKASGNTGNIVLRVIPPTGSIPDSTRTPPNNFNSELTYDVTSSRAWAPSDFNGQITDVAVLTPATGNNKNVRVTQMWLEVTYNTQTISGTKFNDLDGDGIKDSGEPGLSGWTIFIDADSDSNLDAGETSTTTDGSGNYQFTNLAVGTYRIREVPQAGWTQTTANPANVVLSSGTAATGINFGNFQLISISGKKFNDLDADGTDDSGSDPGLAGWTIFNDANNNGVIDGGEASTTTGVGGAFTFTNLGPGTYRIREVAQAGWSQTTVNPSNIVASSGVNVADVKFGNFQLITISGKKFNDLDADGTDDSGTDPGLAGWTVQLDRSPFGSVDQATTTGAGGEYSFTNLGPGTYRIREVSQSGWTQTTTNPSDITAQSGTNVGNINFGNFQLGTISGMKFNDLNNNGVKDSGEPGLSGWAIQLDKDANGSVDQTAVTASGGTYSFTNLGPGTYRIREVVQSGWIQTSANPADIVVSSSGTVATAVDFGNFQLASITGQKFRDKDGNGLKDTGDNGLNGWVVFIDSNNNGALDSGEPTDTTGSGGDYEFDGLSVGTYVIREVLQSGWMQSAPPSGFYSVTITTSGQTVSGRDFGNFELITISGMKFNDLDGNGALDFGEVGLAGWTINLDLGADGTVDDTVSTAADGTYSFSGLGPGTYKVREVQQSGWSQTTADPSDIVAQSGLDVSNVNFGNQLQVGSISGMKFEDHDGDGVKDAGDQGLEGWTIFIDADNSGTLNVGDVSTTTDSNGNYQFADLLPGSYKVMEEQQSGWTATLPALGYYSVLVTPGADSGGNDFGNFELITIRGMKFEDSNGDGDKTGDIGLAGWTIFIDDNNNGLNDIGEPSTTTASDGTFLLSGIGPGTYKVREEAQSGWAQTTSNPADIVTSSGTDVANVDFGNFQLGTISGIKFEDKDGEGDRDLSDTGLEGWTIYIDSNNNGDFDAGEPTSTTSPSGAFNFDGLGVGTYVVREETQSGWTQTFPAAASYSVIISTSGSVVSDKDFGNFKNVAISGQKFEDQDGDGVKDSGEPGLAGWTISLSGPVALSTATDSNGEYSFANLGPGTYLISETLMSDWIQTFPNSPGSHTVLATSGDDVPSKDFGNFQLFDIVGYKYDDINGDGNLGDGVGLAGWIIYLDMNGNEQLDSGEPSDTTDSNGQYTLADLGPSALGKMVREEGQSGYVQTASPTANPVSTASGADLMTGFDFGNFELISISGNKFDDTDGDGSRDLSETGGVAGVSIQLDVGADGSVDDTTTTDSNGDYSFSGLGPGVYRVREVSPSGWMQTTADPSDISAQSGSDVSDVDFGNFELFQISGMKFEDMNGDGAKDSGDIGLAGWTINLEKDGSPYASTLTVADGSYSFAGLGPGEYTTSEVLESGWTQTYPASPGTYTFNGISGSDVSGQDFGNFELITISGLKFEDHDGDGTQDVGDQGLEGWTINLDKDADGSADESTVTAGDGTYSFSDLGPGTYRIREIQQAGWTQTTANPSDIAAESGTDVGSIDFGNFENIAISGIKFEDHDGDGVQDPEDQPLEGWTIQLDIDADGSVDDSEITDVSGGYSFSGLGPGTYRIREVTQPDWTQTTADPSDIVSSSGIDITGLNFGNFQLFDISGIKYEDHNGDGVADSGDQGLQGWTVNLEKDGSPLASATTDPNGEYSFADLGPGEYRITESMQSGWTQTFPSSSVYDVTGSSGIDATNKDFGNFKNFKISGMKFEDHDGDGTQDSGDQGLQDWTIFLDSNGNNVKDPSEPSMLTDSNGNYEFTDLGPGTYSVREELNPGWTQTTMNPDAISGSSGLDVSGINFGNFENFAITGNKFEDTDGDGVRDLGETTGLGGVTIQLDEGADGSVDATTSTDSNGDYSFSDLGPGTYRVREVAPSGWVQTSSDPADVTGASGVDSAGNDFGNFELISISGKKFNDLDGDGTDDSGTDPGLAGWAIFIDANDDGTLNGGETSTTTAGDGSYSFVGLGPGIYKIREELQSGWTMTTANPSDITSLSGTDVTSINFGNFQLITISGNKFVDSNGNGARDTGENTGVQSVVIQLDKSPFGSVDQTTSTDTSGNYQFQNLGPGVYRVRELVPAGWMQTTTDPTDITASSGTNVVGKDFGNFQLVTISGKKYHDLDGDKTDDSGADPGLSGWTIELRNSLNVVIATAVTDSYGNYLFTGVGPGSYTVTEILQSGWRQTFPAKYPLPPGAHSMTTSSGINVGGKDFGNILARSITGFYQPVDMNGVYNIIQNGRAVPLKFDVFIGGTEQTSVSEVVGQTATAKLIQCSSSAPLDDVEVTNTGATALRYDGTAGQFIQNWKTPSGAGKCYAVTITIIDGSSITAYFKTK